MKTPSRFLFTLASLCALFLWGGTSAAPAQSLSDGLIAYWPLDDVQGDKTPDLVNGYDMTLNKEASGNKIYIRCAQIGLGRGAREGVYPQ